LRPTRQWLAGLACLATGWHQALLAAPVDVPMRAISAGTFYVQADIGVGPVDFLVDTGSGYTVIDTRMLDALASRGNARFVKHLEGTMADGSRKVVPIYRVPELRLGGCALRNVEVAIFDAGARPILGMRALKRVSPFTFSIDPPAIRLGSCDSTGAAVAAVAATGAGDVASFQGDEGATTPGP
tara:strand:- start:36422 stop:36973 length:552 start_codon:yes stop_codon:yes gene_type:complete